MAIDWRKILMAYIDHVGENEGVDFLPARVAGLDDKELSALHEAAAESIERVPINRQSLSDRAQINRQEAIEARRAYARNPRPEVEL